MLAADGDGDPAGRDLAAVADPAVVRRHDDPASVGALAAFARADALDAPPSAHPGAYREVAIVRYLEEVAVPITEFGRVHVSPPAVVVAPS